MIDNIWSGWRSQYVSGLERVVVGDGRPRSIDGPSIFRKILESDLSDEETFIIHRGERVFTIMNSYPYSVGHVLVLPYRQIAEISDLDSDEFSELWAEVETAVAVLRDALGPDGFNIGLNLGAASGGSVSEHLHVHVVPRWVGDANFMVSTASVKAIPEALDVTATRLRTAWELRKNDRIANRKEQP
ncbi:MAG: HIT family protein [Actinomycetota bacterium]